jgi:hypothetical protein
MSDFLGNLAARTIAEPTLRPRTRSRFEGPAIEEAPLVWPETPQRVETSPPPAERRRPASRPGGVSPPPSEGGHAVRPAAEDTGVPPTQRDPTGVREVTREVVAHEVEHDVERVIETSERVVRVPAAARPHRFEEQPPRIIERREPREIEEVHRDRVIRTMTAERPQRIAGRSPSPEPAAQPEPVIQVSIGRIDVRAVPSAPPPRSAPRNAAMTIDDYVAKRKAKDRR